jgi:hypothetical protein
MSIAIQIRVWQESQHKGAALLLLLAIADCCNDEGRTASRIACSQPARGSCTWARRGMAGRSRISG